MKIKTISRNFDHVSEFDTEVNKALEEGWELVKRAVIQATTEKYPRRLLYAELIQLDPEPGPEQIEPWEALRQVKEFCASVPPHTCQTGCPLYNWCEQLGEGGDPTDWKLPEG